MKKQKQRVSPGFVCVRIDDDTWRAIKRSVKPFVSANKALRQLLGLPEVDHAGGPERQSDSPEIVKIDNEVWRVLAKTAVPFEGRGGTLRRFLGVGVAKENGGKSSRRA